MSEVTKRDSQGNIIVKHLAFSKKIAADTKYASIVTRNRELINAWERYQKLHDAVLDRAGTEELLEQNNFRDNVYDAFLCASSNFSVWLEENIPQQLNSPSANDKSTTPRHEKIAHIIIDLENRTAARIETMLPDFADLQLKMLDDYNVKYQQAVLEYIATADDDDAAHAIEGQGETTDAYLRTASSLRTRIPAVVEGADPATVCMVRTGEVQIPKLQINPFDGNPSHWESFRGSFEQSFHLRTSIPAVQK